MFYPDKSNPAAPAELVKTPKEMLPSSPTAVPSPEVQKESATGASRQEMSVAAPLPPNLTESLGQSDADCLCQTTSSFKGQQSSII